MGDVLILSFVFFLLLLLPVALFLWVKGLDDHENLGKVNGGRGGFVVW